MIFGAKVTKLLLDTSKDRGNPVTYLSQQLEKSAMNSSLTGMRPEQWSIAAEYDSFPKNELTAVRDNLKTGKAIGPDGVTAETMRIAAQIIPNELIGVFNEIAKNPYLSKTLKKGKGSTNPQRKHRREKIQANMHSRHTMKEVI